MAAAAFFGGILQLPDEVCVLSDVTTLWHALQQV